MNESKISKAVRAAFRDAAYPFRMGAGFAGDVNRTHPVDIQAMLIAASANPPQQYGIPVIFDAGNANNVRQLTVGDGAVAKVVGFAVRPFPMQQQTQTSSTNPSPFGSVVPPLLQPLDVARFGMVMVQLPTDAAAVIKGGQVFVWIAASVGTHVQGGVEAAASGGNTASLDASLYYFNGPADSAGVAEVSVNVAH